MRASMIEGQNSGSRVVLTSEFNLADASIQDHFAKLQNIKKPGMLGIFKKTVDVREEDALKLMQKSLELISPTEYFDFVIKNYKEIQIFFGISFYPANRNQPLADLCSQVSIKMITRIAEVYIDVTQKRRDFKNKQIADYRMLEIMRNIFDQSVGFLSIIFIGSERQSIGYMIKLEKLKIFQNLVHRMSSSSTASSLSQKSPRGNEACVVFRQEIEDSISDKDEAKLMTMSLAWFEVFGNLLEHSNDCKIEIARNDFALEVNTKIKQRNLIFHSLDKFCEKLLEVDNEKGGLMGIMEKNLAKFINQVLDKADNKENGMDLDLFTQMFNLINRLFQRRKKLFGSPTEEPDEYFYQLSSSDHNSARHRFHMASTLSREKEEESSSFQQLQEMTGILYLQLIKRLLYGPDGTWVQEFNIFSLFTNEEDLVSFIEIFEPIFSLTLIKKLLTCFKKYIVEAAIDAEMRRRVTVLFGIDKCKGTECSCFVFNILTLLFKLSMKCDISLLKDTMDVFYHLMETVLSSVFVGKSSLCYLNNFTKMFTSLLRQNLNSFDSMTISLLHTSNDCTSEDDCQPIHMVKVVDSRRTVQNCFRKFNVFVDEIEINGQPVRVTKEICESILLILSGTHRVDEFTRDHPCNIDLGFDEHNTVDVEEIMEAIQQRWQVRLLAFRTLLVEVSSKMLKILYCKEEAEPIFQGFLKFFKQLNSGKGSTTHSFYIGFITWVFLDEHKQVNYYSDYFGNFLIIYDIALRGLGYYDRDTRLSLPVRIQKDFVNLFLQYLKKKFEPRNTRLIAIQLLISHRLQEMFTIDPPIIKSTVPLIFDIANEVMSNLDTINVGSPFMVSALKLILEENYSDPINSILVVIIRLFTSVVTISIPFAKFPIILKPHLLVSGRLVPVGDFPYKTFQDIKKYLLRPEHITSLIKLVDAKSNNSAPQVELAKYLSLSACYCQEILLVIYPVLLAHCLDNLKCSDEDFKVRMQLFISFLTLEKFVFTCSTALSQFIDKSQSLLLKLVASNSKSEKKTETDDGVLLSAREIPKRESGSFSSTQGVKTGHVKKQWILTLLTKWVFLSSHGQLPLQKLWSMIFFLKQTRDVYLVENCKILESYLSAMKGIFESGTKELRNPSYFDESNVMSRSNMDKMMLMIDKFCRDETFEEEARLLQHSFQINLFEFFSEDRKSMSVNKLFETLLSSVKKNNFKWMFLFDAKNVILYSIAETTSKEICVIKRHISGKNSWFLQESFKNIYVSKEKLDLIDPKDVAKMPYAPPDNNHLLLKLTELYRKEPEIFNYFTSKSLDNDVLALEGFKQPERVSNFDKLPSHLKEYWNVQDGLKSQSEAIPAQTNADNATKGPLTFGSNIDNPDSAVESSSNLDSQPKSSSQSTVNLKLVDARESGQEFEGRNRLLNANLRNPCYRFILQMELFDIPSQEEASKGEYYLIRPKGEKSAFFKNELNFIDKSRIVSCFKVGILFVSPDQTNEKQILSNTFPESGLFNTFVNNLGEKVSESAFAKNLGNDMVHYTIGPLIPRKDQGTFEVKRIVGNVPSLLIWTQNPLINDYENIKSKFNRDIIIVEELPSQLLRIRSLRKIEDKRLETVFLPDSILTLQSLLNILPSYIYSSQMELNPIIFGALKEEYKSISPFLDARKRQLNKLLESYKEDCKPMNLETVLDLLFND